MPSVLQHTYNESTGTGLSGISKAFASNVTAGSTIIVTVGWYDDPSGTVSVADVPDGTYASSVALINDNTAGSVSQQIFHFSNSAAMTAANSTVTATFSTTVDFPWIHITEVSGLATSSAVDAAVSNKGTSGNATTGSLVTTNANDFLYSAGSTNNTWSGGDAAYTVLDITAIDGNLAQYRNVTSTGSYTATASPSQIHNWVIQQVGYKAVGGATNVNATVSISARATATLPPRVLHNSTVVFSAHGAIQARMDFGVFAQLIVIGRATSSSFTTRIQRNAVTQIAAKATGALNPKVTHNATLSIAGTANFRPNGMVAPVFLNATVNIFAFAADSTVIAPIRGRATGRFSSQIVLYQVTINGRATFSPVARVVRNVPLGISARASGAFRAQVTGPGGAVYGTVLLAGRATFGSNARLLNNAVVFIFAGNQTPLPTVNGTLSISGRATLALTAFTTHNAKTTIFGRASGLFNGLVTGGPVTNINAAVQIAGRATLRVALPTIPVDVTVSLRGQAVARYSPVSILHENAVVNILGTASASTFYGTSFGAFFLNNVVRINGRGILAPLATLQNYPTVRLAGRASAFFYGGLIARQTVKIQGRATLRVQTPRQSLVWASAKTLQYKVWQYRLESMTRVLGTSFTVTSVGMSFQSVAMEVTLTDAGWGS